MCVGVFCWLVYDFNYCIILDMWFYRVYSGNFYYNGEQIFILFSFI